MAAALRRAPVTSGVASQAEGRWVGECDLQQAEQ